jgi:hypothetical protein
MAEAQELNLDQADEVLVAALKLASVAAKHFGVPQVAEACDYIVEHADERRWLLSFLGLTNEQALVADISEPMSAFLGDNLSSLLELAALIKKYAPLVKEYMPQILAALETMKVLFDLFKGIAPSVPAVGDAVIRHPKF